MDFDLTPEQELIRDTVRTFARERVEPVAEELDRESRFPYELVAELAELGLMGLPIPEEYGGAGGDTVSYAIAIEELTRDRLVRRDHGRRAHLARHDADPPVRDRGAEAAVAAGPRLAGKQLAAFGLTEPGAGSDAGNTRTTAELRDGSWVINGSKIFITNAGTDITWGVTITARTGEDEISNIVVENGTPGLHDLCADEEARLARVRHARALVRGLRGAGGESPRRARRTASSSSSRSSTAGGSRSPRWASGSRRARTTSRTRTRRSASSSASRSRAFQAIQFKLADMATEIEAGRALVYKAAWLKDQGRTFAREAAMAKLYTGELSNRVVDAALQIHGGFGYMEESAISRFYRDQKILEIGEGTNEVQRMVIARLLGL